MFWLSSRSKSQGFFKYGKMKIEAKARCPQPSGQGRRRKLRLVILSRAEARRSIREQDEASLTTGGGPQLVLVYSA